VSTRDADAEPPRFGPAKRDADEVDALWEQAQDSVEVKRERRLETTLLELSDVVADAKLLADEGEHRYRATRSLQLASEAVISHLGEVVNRLPRSYLERHSDVPWHQLVGMRNRIVHDYQHISLDLMWSALSHRIPALAKQLDLPDQGLARP
jgi:uncharacterized protein with HEPN domain